MISARWCLVTNDADVLRLINSIRYIAAGSKSCQAQWAVVQFVCWSRICLRRGQSAVCLAASCMFCDHGRVRAIQTQDISGLHPVAVGFPPCGNFRQDSGLVSGPARAGPSRNPCGVGRRPKRGKLISMGAALMCGNGAGPTWLPVTDRGRNKAASCTECAERSSASLLSDKPDTLGAFHDAKINAAHHLMRSFRFPHAESRRAVGRSMHMTHVFAPHRASATRGYGPT